MVAEGTCVSAMGNEKMILWQSSMRAVILKSPLGEIASALLLFFNILILT